MDLVLVRHGESTNNALFRQAGLEAHAPSGALAIPGRVADPELSSRGREQAAEAAAHLATLSLRPPVRLVASPTARAVQTAAVIAHRFGLPLSVDPRWVEGGGIYTWVEGVRVPAPGRDIADLERLAGRPLAAESVEGWSGGFEGFDSVAERARLVVAEQRVLPGTTVAVTHEFFSQFVIRVAMGLPATREEVLRSAFALPNAGIALLGLASDGARLERLTG